MMNNTTFLNSSFYNETTITVVKNMTKLSIIAQILNIVSGD